MAATPSVSRTRLRRNWIIDSGILASFLITINLVFAGEDPGFLKLNPSPYFLLPILVGLWYGFFPGLVTGLILAGLVYLVRFWSELSSGFFVPEELYWFLALPFLGAICGEAFKSARYKRDAATAEAGHSRNRTKELASDLEHLRLIKDQLERQILKQDSKTFSFDNEIRALYETPEAMFGDSLLQSLTRTERVYDAGFYLLKDERLTRQAWLGSEEHFNEMIDHETDPMIREMLESGEVRALPEFIGKVSDELNDSRYLACFPLKGGDDVIGAIVIAGLPFINFERTTLRRIDTFCQWASQILMQRMVMHQDSIRKLAGHAKRRIFDPRLLYERLSLAMTTRKQLQIPYSLLLMYDADDHRSQENFESALGGAIRSGDTLTVVASGKPHLLLLAPFTGTRAEEVIEKRIRAAWARSELPADSLKLRFLNREDFDLDAVIEEIERVVS